MPINLGGNELNSLGTKLLNDTSIITSTLVLYLDAGIANSYPGSGTTWTDLSGNGNNFTLYNGVSYSTANGGILTFDGTNDYAASNSNINLTSYSYVVAEIFYKTNGLSNPILFEHTPNWNTNPGGFGLSIDGDGNNTVANLNHTNHNSEGAKNYAVTNNTLWNNNLNLFSRISDSTGRLTYANGALVPFSPIGGYNTDTITTAGGSFANSIFYIGSRGGSSAFFNGNVGSLKIYGFKIDATQTLQNFNSSRQRFGI
jgi:hypothetical protein